MMDMEINTEMEREEESESDSSSEGSSAGSVYCNLEQDFLRIRNEMKNNEALAFYEPEYKRLFESLYEGHRLQDELNKKCKSMQDKLIDGNNKVSELEKLVAFGEENVEQLKKEIIKNKKLADVAHEREQKAQEVIGNLRISITKLTDEINQKSKQLSPEEEEEVPAPKEKDNLAKEHERLLGENDTLKQRLKSIATYNQEMEIKLTEAQSQIEKMHNTIDQQSNDMLKLVRDREKAEAEVENSYEKLKLQSNELQTVEENLKEAQNNTLKQEKLLMDQIMETEKNHKEVQRLMFKETTMKVLTDKLESKIGYLDKDLVDKSLLLKDLNKEMKRNKEDLAKIKVEKDNLQSKFTKEKTKSTRTEEAYKRTLASLKSADMEITSLKKHLEAEKKISDKLNREKEAIAKTVIDLEEANTKLNSDIRVFEQTNNIMQSSIDEMTEAANERKRYIKKIETEKDRFVIDIQDLTGKVEDYADDLKLKRMEIIDYQKRILEADAKLRQQQTMFDDIRAERNSYKKNLLLAQDEIIEFKTKVKNLNMQINNLKDQLSEKEAELMKQEFLYNKLEKEKEGLKNEITNVRKQMAELRQEMDKMRQEEKMLNATLQERDLNIFKQKKEIESLMNERDIIGTQIVRRNDELSLNYNKIQILTGTLARGEKQYSQRLEEIKILQLELKKLKLRNMALEKNSASLCDLRDEVMRLERNLTQERLKVMALEEEVQNPLNIHRWRSLEGSDPEAFELLKKIQMLQKRIIKLSSELIMKDKKIKEMEKLYLNLRNAIAKKPGPEILVHLNSTRRALRDRGNKMKSLVAELNMAITTEHKFELDKLKKELNSMKVKYLAQKKKNLKPCGSFQQNKSSGLVNTKKFYGGGFNMGNVMSSTSIAQSTTAANQ